MTGCASEDSASDASSTADTKASKAVEAAKVFQSINGNSLILDRLNGQFLPGGLRTANNDLIQMINKEPSGYAVFNKAVNNSRFNVERIVRETLENPQIPEMPAISVLSFSCTISLSSAATEKNGVEKITIESLYDGCKDLAGEYRLQLR